VTDISKKQAFPIHTFILLITAHAREYDNGGAKGRKYRTLRSVILFYMYSRTVSTYISYSPVQYERGGFPGIRNKEQGT